MNIAHTARVGLIGLVSLLAVIPFTSSAATCPNLYPSTGSGQARNLSVGSHGTDVVELQTFLIAQGDLSSGLNTGYFGRLTEAAVKSWQAKNGVVSSGTAATTGYGAVGPRTRAKIASVCGTGGGTVSTNFSASPTSGDAPLVVTFSAYGIDDSRHLYVIDPGDGSSYGGGLGMFSSPKTGPSTHTYVSAGTYIAKLLQPSEVMTNCIGCPQPPPKVVGTVTITVTSGAQTVNNNFSTPTRTMLQVDFSDQMSLDDIRSFTSRLGLTLGGTVSPLVIFGVNYPSHPSAFSDLEALFASLKVQALVDQCEIYTRKEDVEKGYTRAVNAKCIFKNSIPAAKISSSLNAHSNVGISTSQAEILYWVDFPKGIQVSAVGTAQEWINILRQYPEVRSVKESVPPQLP